MSFGAAVTRWDQYTVPDANADGVDPNLARAIMTAESGGQQTKADGTVLTSPTGALGLMQLEPGTAAALGVNPLDPAANIKGGVDYIAQLLKRFGGDRTKAVAAYNAGPNAVDQYGGVPPYAETKRYVASVNALLAASGSPTPTTASGITDPHPLDNPAQKWIYENVPVVSAIEDPVGTIARGSTGTDWASTLAGAANTIAAEALIGAVFLAIIAGGFAIAAQPER